MDKFLQRKKSVLLKLDKSTIGSWDKKIKSLCEKINKSENYYTTSSCAGRIVLIFDKSERDDVFVKVWHDKVSFENLDKELKKIKKGNIKFKQEPPIIHIACWDLESAREILAKARAVGFKRSGVISFDKNKFVVEILSTEKIEFPIIDNFRILVDESFLRLVLKKANENLMKGWGKIEGLNKKFTEQESKLLQRFVNKMNKIEKQKSISVDNFSKQYQLDKLLF